MSAPYDPCLYDARDLDRGAAHQADADGYFLGMWIDDVGRCWHNGEQLREASSTISQRMGNAQPMEEVIGLSIARP